MPEPTDADAYLRQFQAENPDVAKAMQEHRLALVRLFRAWPAFVWAISENTAELAASLARIYGVPEEDAWTVEAVLRKLIVDAGEKVGREMALRGGKEARALWRRHRQGRGPPPPRG